MMKSADLIKLGVICGAAFFSARYALKTRQGNVGAVISPGVHRSQGTSPGKSSNHPLVARQPRGLSIERKTQPAAPTIKQEMLIEHGAQASYTWAIIARAENDLRNSSLRAMSLSDPPMLVSDCFTKASEPVGEFRYTLHVTSKRDVITVGDFKASDTLPRQVSECLDSAFAGEATIETPTGPDEDGFLEFDIFLDRQDFTALATIRMIESSSRDEFLEAASHAFGAEPELSPEEQGFQNDLGLPLDEFREKRQLR